MLSTSHLRPSLNESISLVKCDTTNLLHTITDIRLCRGGGGNQSLYFFNTQDVCVEKGKKRCANYKIK